jgi:predicted Fe-Mo cluster-binding NifX family protein
MIGAPLPGSGNYLKEMLDLFSDLKTKTGKEIVVIFDNRANQVEDVAVEKVSRKMRMAFQAQGIPVFPNVERALRAIRHAVSAMRSGTAVSRM